MRETRAERERKREEEGAAAANMAANLEEQQCLRECTEYMQRSNIVPVMKDCFVQLCVDKPEKPVTYLREYFQKLERVSAALFLPPSLSLIHTQTLVSIYTLYTHFSPPTLYVYPTPNCCARASLRALASLYEYNTSISNWPSRLPLTMRSLALDLSLSAGAPRGMMLWCV